MAGGIYQSLRSGSSEIRLLTLLPSLTFSAPIECMLETTTLAEEKRTYKAISYAWGDPNKTVLISINAVDVYINNSLASALRYIRHTTDLIVLWADAICINQDDDSEKNHQVQIMRSIYAGAESVIAWLGEPSDDSDLAMDIIANPPKDPDGEESDGSGDDTTSDEQDDHDNDEAEEGSYEGADDDEKNKDKEEGNNKEGEPDKNEKDGMEEETDEDARELDDGDEESEGKSEIGDSDDSSTSSDSYETFRPPAFVKDAPIYSPEELQAVKSLLQRSWWGRLWVVQEALFAKKLIFKCGHKEVPRKMFLTWQELWVMGYGLPPDGQHLTELVQAGAIISYAEYEQGDYGELLDLIQLLRDFAYRGTSMPEDRVYGLLSLASDAEEYGPPDYSKRAEDIYTHVALVALKQPDPLWILHHAGTSNKAGCIDMDFPSWVPNWTRSYVYDMWASFDASPDIEPKHEVSEDSLILVVEGLVYDTILTSGPIAHIGLGEIPLWEELLPQNKPQLYKTGVPQIQAIFRTLLMDTDIQPGSRIDTGREEFFDLLTAFLYELGTSGSAPDPAQEDISQEINSSKYTDNLLKWIKERRDGRSDQDILSLFLDDYARVESYLKWLEEKDADEMIRFYTLYRIVRNIVVGTTGREIFRTDRGLLGNAQVGIEAGDLVCVLLGCNVPVLLRQVESHHVLVCPCFVLGLMDGEAIHDLDAGKVHLQKFAIS